MPMSMTFKPPASKPLTRDLNKRRRAQPAIASDGNGLYTTILDIGAVGATDLFRNRLCQFLAHNAAKIVFPKQSHQRSLCLSCSRPPIIIFETHDVVFPK